MPTLRAQYQVILKIQLGLQINIERINTEQISKRPFADYGRGAGAGGNSVPHGLSVARLGLGRQPESGLQQIWSSAWLQ